MCLVPSSWLPCVAMKVLVCSHSLVASVVGRRPVTGKCPLTNPPEHAVIFRCRQATPRVRCFCMTSCASEQLPHHASSLPPWPATAVTRHHGWAAEERGKQGGRQPLIGAVGYLRSQTRAAGPKRSTFLEKDCVRYYQLEFVG